MSSTGLAEGDTLSSPLGPALAQELCHRPPPGDGELMRADGLGDRYYIVYQSAAAIHGVAQPLPFALQIALPIQRRSVNMGQGGIRFIRIQPQTLLGSGQSSTKRFRSVCRIARRRCSIAWSALTCAEASEKRPDLRALPAGQLVSCAEDMAHYLMAHRNGGRFGDAQILSGAGIDELHRGTVEWIELGMSHGRSGMGWCNMDVGQTRTLARR